MLIFLDFIQVYVFTTNHHLNLQLQNFNQDKQLIKVLIPNIEGIKILNSKGDYSDLEE